MTEIELFLNHLQSEDLTAGTLANYRSNLRQFGRWLIDHNKTVASLTQADLRDYKTELKDCYKPATINTKLAFISSLLAWCFKSGLISENPMTKIKRLRSEEYSKWLTQEQVAATLQKAQEVIDNAIAREFGLKLTVAIRVHSIAIFLLNTGLRVSELCDLCMDDIKNGVITVRWGKGGKRREIPINEQARAALDTWLKVRQSDTDYVFVTDGRMSRQVVQWHLAQLGKRLDFHLTPHLLRHTFGKNLVDKGVSLDRVAKLMGHSNINTTAIYTIPSLSDLSQAVKLLD